MGDFRSNIYYFQRSTRDYARRRGSFLLALVLALTVVFGTLLALHSDVRAVPVLSGSMAPKYKTGALVVTHSKPASKLQTGDVIAFRPPVGYTNVNTRPVMHRVVQIEQRDGHMTVMTKGDANASPDPWLLDMQGVRVHTAGASVPFVGRLVAGIVSSDRAVETVSLVGACLLFLTAWILPKVRSASYCNNCGRVHRGPAI